ncbi:alpha/beta hydrolase [Pandoraea terrae]|uniref:Alpha/beta hydrolase n=2 Tax=Pandoraea terrae TaxID=1537710 RepID=A0A5E4TS85_9BURK|nr:alpha/beta hydrolase [Pandoraea terrae]
MHGAMRLAVWLLIGAGGVPLASHAAGSAPTASAPASSPAANGAPPTGLVRNANRADGTPATLRVFRPVGACAGAAILSPGAGGDQDALAWLGRALSQYGWLTIVMGHKESSRDSLRDRVRSGGLRDGLLSLTTDPAAYRDRLQDVGAALQWSRGRCQASPAVLVGHSMGAATALLEAGAKNNLKLDGADRFDAYIALSPQGPGPIFPDGAWHDLQKPMLMITGTRDAPLDGKWQSRTEPYADLPPGCHWLAVVDGATHFNFAGFGYGHGDIEARILPLIERFLDNVREHRCAVPGVPGGVKLDTK